MRTALFYHPSESYMGYITGYVVFVASSYVVGVHAREPTLRETTGPCCAIACARESQDYILHEYDILCGPTCLPGIAYLPRLRSHLKTNEFLP